MRLTVFGLKTVVAAGVLAAAVSGAVIARADDLGAHAAVAEGGLGIGSLTNGDMALSVDRTAQAGATDGFRISNRSSKALVLTVKARPWTQSASGAVAPNRRATLPDVGVSQGDFTLPPGAEKDLSVTLNAVPAAGYLYGALEVVGLPPGAEKATGVVTGYRLVSALRYHAARPVYRLKVGAAKISGKGAKQTLALSVRNAGNTVAPVTGTVTLKGVTGRENVTVRSTRILPGKSIALALGSLSSVRAGSYTATVTLIQNRQRTTLTKKLRVR